MSAERKCHDSVTRKDQKRDRQIYAQPTLEEAFFDWQTLFGWDNT